MADKNHIKPLAQILLGGGDFMDGWMGHGVFLVEWGFLAVWSIDVVPNTTLLCGAMPAVRLGAGCRRDVSFRLGEVPSMLFRGAGAKDAWPL